MYKLFFICIFSFISGCSVVTETAPDTGVLLIGENVYEIMDTDYRGIFGSENSLMDRNLKKVERFSLERNMVAVPLEARIHRVGILADWAWFYYKFKLVEPIKSKDELKFSDITVQRDARLSEEFYKSRNIKIGNVSTTPQKVDIYDELLRLNELKEKGILTEAEFTQEKTKLLNN